MGQVIYYKVRQISVESGVDIIKWGNFITKSGRYCKVGNYYRKALYILVILRQMETHVYEQSKCGLRTESYMI